MKQLSGQSESKPAQPHNATARGWRQLQQDFQLLANEEIVRHSAGGDRLLCAYFTFMKSADVDQIRDDARIALETYMDRRISTAPELLNVGMEVPATFCFLKVPQYGLWALSECVNENFRERFHTVTEEAAVALGRPEHTDPVIWWLYKLLLYLREIKSSLLDETGGEVGLFYSKSKSIKEEGRCGIIIRVFEASASFCARLQRRPHASTVYDSGTDKLEREIMRGKVEDAFGDVSRWLRTNPPGEQRAYALRVEEHLRTLMACVVLRDKAAVTKAAQDSLPDVKAAMKLFGGQFPWSGLQAIAELVGAPETADAGASTPDPVEAQNIDKTGIGVGISVVSGTRRSPESEKPTQYRARVTETILDELKTIKPKMHNEAKFGAVKAEYQTFLIFKIANDDQDVKLWIENIQERRDVVKLAQEISARHFKKPISTLATDWTHRKKPRKKASR